MQTQHYVGVSHGNEKFRSNTSFNYSWQDALTKNSNYSRYGIRSNNDYTVSKIISIGADISIRNVDNKDAASNAATWAGDGGTAIEQLLRNPAIYATRYSNGYWGAGFAGSGTRRMIIEEELEMRYENWQDISAKLSSSITPFKGLRLDMWYVPHWANYDRKYVLKTMPIYDYKTGEAIYSPTDLPNTSEQFDKTLENDVNITANYTKSLGKHDLTLLGGFQYLENDYRTRGLARTGNSFQDFEEIGAYSPVGMSNSGSRTQWALMSYFGRANYAFDNKYLLEANVRYDGSSRFANGHKWGVFPSFSGAWRFQAEEFMKDISWLNNGKLRASWGSLGNQSGLGNYPFSLLINTSQHQVFDGTMAPGYAPINYAMQNITWESTQMTNIGLDLGFFDKKLDITFDWYKKSTNDILLSLPIPSVMGYTNSPRQNAGVIENVGWDLSISHANTVGDFYYKVTGVLSDVKNKIVDIGKLPIYNDLYIQQNGSSYNSIYGYVAEGLFESFDQAKNHPTKQWGSLQGGDIKYKDLDGSGAINANDREVLGSSLPRWNYSLDLYGSYKGFDLSIFFQGVGKRDGYLSGWLAYPLSGSATSLEQHMDRWNETNPNPNAPYPRLSINNQTNNTQFSSFWLTNAAYLRLKNIQIGWSMPERFLTGKGISSLRLFVSGSNLLTFTSIAQGLDPEAPDQRTANAYPILKTYTFGLEIKF